MSILRRRGKPLKPPKMKNTTRFKSLDVIEQDSRIHSAWTENDNVFGDYRDEIWISLELGYNVDGCGVIHEPTVGDALKRMKSIKAGQPY